MNLDEGVPNGFKSYFTYEVEYHLRGARIGRKQSLNDFWPVMIDDVQLAAAPVAYRISSTTSAHDPYEVRAYRDELWWPLYSESGHMSAEEFLHVARGEWEVARTILDPLQRTFASVCPSEKEFFGELVLGKKGVRRLNWKEQKARSERNVARIIFCDRRVLVEAGPPVWYASFTGESRDSLDLVVGHSAPDRGDGRYRIPGPNFELRERCARMNRAYGLGEAEDRLRSLGITDVSYCSNVEVLIDCAANSSAELCARALLQYLWRIAPHKGLDKAMPAFQDSKGRGWPPDELPSRAVLLEFMALVRAEPGIGLNNLADDAERILERWDQFDSPPLTFIEDEFLANLAI